jgi:hypothetical protein
MWESSDLVGQPFLREYEDSSSLNRNARQAPIFSQKSSQAALPLLKTLLVGRGGDLQLSSLSSNRSNWSPAQLFARIAKIGLSVGLSVSPLCHAQPRIAPALSGPSVPLNAPRLKRRHERFSHRVCRPELRVGAQQWRPAVRRRHRQGSRIFPRSGGQLHRWQVLRHNHRARL